jgi:nucleoside-diphosphate-sugar epimerase
MRKVLVTGSSGFIGSHLVTALIEKGWDVYALVREATDTSWLEKQKVHLVKSEYSDRASLERAVRGMDYIFHLAAVLYGADWEPFYKANVQGTENLLAACAHVNPGLKKFIYVSSIAASGPSVKGRLKDEDDECLPTSLYGKSKLAAEKIVRVYGDRLPFVILRPPNVLGTRQQELKTLLLTLKKGISPRLGIGEKQTTICFVEDVVRSLILVAEEDAATGRTYFVTDNDTHSWREMIDTSAGIMGKKFILKIPFPMVYAIALISEGLSRVFGMKQLVNMIDIVDSRKRYWLFKSEKIQKELGFSPRITFAEGMKKIIDHYRQEGVL